MRRLRVRMSVALGVVGGVLLVPAVAFAHPLGTFTVNTSAAIVLTPGTVRVDYVVDMAEIPTVQVMGDLDADGDGTVTSPEADAWASARAPELLGNLILTVDGRPAELDISSAGIELSPGQGGLEVLRLEATFSGGLAADGELAFRDGNFAGRAGWHEVTAAATDGVALGDSNVPAVSVTDGLRTYPDDPLSSPLDVREATVAFAPGAAALAAEAEVEPAPASRPGVVGGAFASLVDRTGPVMLLAFAVAFGFGAVHALGPGHGKTLMAAYLVGGGGRARQAVAVGAAVAVMHTASVLALGFVVLSATEVFAPERVYPWLGLASGLVAFGLGASLLVARLGAWGDRARIHRHEGVPVDAVHEHAHPHAASPGRPLSGKGLAGLAVAGGILPSPTALVVLLASVAIHRVGYGLALIGAFSLGLAAALVAVGVLALRARDVVVRRMSGRAARLVHLGSAAAIALLGLALAANGLSQL